VLALGGFTGFAPEPTLTRIQQLVRNGQLKFFLLGTQAGPAGRNSGTELNKVTSWVEGSCREVPAKNYGDVSATARASLAGGGPATLYQCGTSN
jgi:hypothetical protein